MSCEILYKTFIRNEHGHLLGPLTKMPYYSVNHNSKGVILTVKNAKGFISQEILGDLDPCLHGYHAFEAKNIKAWGAEGWRTGRSGKERFVTYRIILRGAINSFGVKWVPKWVGKQFSILDRVTNDNLWVRRWRD